MGVNCHSLSETRSSVLSILSQLLQERRHAFEFLAKRFKISTLNFFRDMLSTYMSNILI